MAWSVALNVDDSTTASAIALLTRQMPVWAVDNPERRHAAAQIREASDPIWAPEPALTLFNHSVDYRASFVSNMVDTIRDHHPSLVRVVVFGACNSFEVVTSMAAKGWRQISKYPHEGLAFARPIEELTNVQDLTLDVQDWQGTDDLYQAFFAAVGAPDWHGKNFDALRDSIGTGRINRIEVPYRIHIANYRTASPGARESVHLFLQLIDDLRSEGCPVSAAITPHR